MNKLLFFSIFFLLSNLSGQKNNEINPILGSWKSEKSRLMILDGFVSNKGAVISINSKGKTVLGTWTKQPKGFKISVGWNDERVKFDNEKSFSYNDELYSRDGNLSQEGIVTLKKDQENFIQELISRKWKKSGSKEFVFFKTTFSKDSGVREIHRENAKIDLGSWGISSGVMKISNTLIIQARITEKFLIGLDEDNDFYILERNEKALYSLIAQSYLIN